MATGLHTSRRAMGGPADLSTDERVGDVIVRQADGTTQLQRAYTPLERDAVVLWSKWSPEKRNQVAAVIGWRPGETPRPN